MDLLHITRRALLRGLAAASAAGAVIGTETAIAASSAPAESAELIRLGDELPQAVAEYFAADRACQTVVNDWWNEWPIAPESIVLPYRDTYQWECMFTGACILPDRSVCKHDQARHTEEPRSIATSDYFARAVRSAERSLARKRPKHPLTPDHRAELEASIAEYSRRHVEAVAYEAEKARVLAASGWEAADTRFNEARKAVSVLIVAIMAQPAAGMDGIIIKAQALGAYERLGDTIIGFTVPMDARKAGLNSLVGTFASEFLSIAARNAG